MRITDGPKIGQPPTVLQSADAVELNRALAQAQQAFALYELAGQELADLLRDHWKSPDADNMTIFLNAIIGGIVESWSKNPPPNGYTHAAEWPGIGKLEISIRTIKGKSAAESLRDREATLAQRDARIAELERALREWSELADHLGLSTQSHRNRTRDLLASTAPEHPDTRRLDSARDERLRAEAAVEALRPIPCSCRTVGTTSEDAAVITCLRCRLWSYYKSEAARIREEAGR